MKVLILSVTAGQGHNSCGQSVMTALEAKGVSCMMLDTVKFINKFAGDVTDKGYLAMSKFTPKLWKTMFENALRISKDSKGLRKEMIQLVMTIGSGKMLEQLKQYKPDCIVCTHIFPSLLLTIFRKHGQLNIPVVGINTDFILHPFWEDVSQDFLVLACDKMDYGAMMRGVKREQILPWGIPVDEKFALEQTKEEARRQLGLQERPTILFMSGSMGFGNMLESVKGIDALPFDVQICVVCGSNAKALAQIENTVFKKAVMPYGFVKNVDVLMRAADIICTKPGGLSVSEALCVGARPIVLMPPIPGLEDFNAAFLVNCAAVAQTSRYYSLEEAIFNLLSNPARMQDMLRAAVAISPRGSAIKLADHIIEICRQKEE